MRRDGKQLSNANNMQPLEVFAATLVDRQPDVPVPNSGSIALQPDAMRPPASDNDIVSVPNSGSIALQRYRPSPRSARLSSFSTQLWVDRSATRHVGAQDVHRLQVSVPNSGSIALQPDAAGVDGRRCTAVSVPNSGSIALQQWLVVKSSAENRCFSTQLWVDRSATRGSPAYR